jgi:hypothetical protein
MSHLKAFKIVGSGHPLQFVEQILNILYHSSILFDVKSSWLYGRRFQKLNFMTLLAINCTTSLPPSMPNIFSTKIILPTLGLKRKSLTEPVICSQRDSIPKVHGSRIHERTTSLSFLGIILRVLGREDSLYNVYITDQFQTIFARRGGEVGVKLNPLVEVTVNSNEFCPNYVQEYGLKTAWNYFLNTADGFGKPCQSLGKFWQIFTGATCKLVLGAWTVKDPPRAAEKIMEKLSVSAIFSKYCKFKENIKILYLK